MDLHEIQQIRDQFIARQWPKFLDSVSIEGLRGWNGQTVTLGFPVVGVVGENGTGKTTLLRAIACAYEADGGEQLFPSDFFVDTTWDKFTNVTLTYDVRQGDKSESFKLRKPTERWSYPDRRAKRNVFFFDISRILPLDASVGYAKIAKMKAAEISAEEISDEYRQRLNHILGRTYTNARFATTGADAKKTVGVLSRDSLTFSQFHQGAGEDATLDLVAKLQAIPNHSRLVIDEVEASLHPRAQRRLIRFLLWLSRQKRLQIVVSTHSPYVLEELPQDARVMLLPGPAGFNVVYGASAPFALSRLDESVHPELYVYVEDREGEVLCREILAADARGRELLPRIATVAVGPANVVKIMGQLGVSSRLPNRSLAIVDGDMASVGCIKFPGAAAPERMVFTDLRATNWNQLVARFGVGAGDLHQWLEDAMLEPDHHHWTRLVGDRILKSKSAVWETLASEWCRACLSTADRERFVAEIEGALANVG